ncbi:MAG: hypothetical protein MZV70_33765 [Desulfobacterales bacterium]|nr:hypothetical protein [Desulfobacterales bacterium]
MDAFKELLRRSCRVDPETGKSRLRHRSRPRTSSRRSAWCSAPAGTARAPSRRPSRPRHLADERVHRPRLLRRGPGGDLRRAARRPVDRHADAHAAVRPAALRLRLARRHQARAAVPAESRRSASTMTVQAFDLAERLQTPVFVMSDLDIGMNDWMCRDLTWDDAYRPDRGKVLTPDELEALPKFHRYLDVDGDGIPYRTLPGRARQGRVLHARLRPQPVRRATPRTAPSTRWCMRPPRAQVRARARRCVPPPVIEATGTSDVGLVAIGSSRRRRRRGARHPGEARHRRSTTCASRPSRSRTEVEEFIGRARDDLRRRAEPRRAAARRC